VPLVTLKFTVTPPTGAGGVLLSVTLTASGANGWPMTTVWPSPEVLAMSPIVTVAVSVKRAGVAFPALRRTVTVPAVGPSVTRVEVRPLASVVVPADVSVAEPAITDHCTVWFAIGLPNWSFTTATSGSGSACPVAPLWLLPEMTEQVVGTGVGGGAAVTPTLSNRGVFPATIA
jgi:hypothetical protein